MTSSALLQGRGDFHPPCGCFSDIANSSAGATGSPGSFARPKPKHPSRSALAASGPIIQFGEIRAMTKPTGRPRGRPPGARNKRTEAVERAARTAAAVIESALPEAFQGDAHAFLMAVYKNPEHDIGLRVDAAKAAVRFEKPMLSSVEAKVEATMRDLTDADLDRRISAAAVAAGVAGQPTEH